MRRVLLITLSLVLALVGWSAVGAEDGFYVISTMKRNYAPVPKTGQTTSYFTGDDADWHKGVASPSPRFTDNGNGTVTDNLTGLIWMENSVAFGFIRKNLFEALDTANALASGSGGLTDGSQAGDWRLPNLSKLQSLVDYGIAEVMGGGALPAGHPFKNVVNTLYWSSSVCATKGGFWCVDFGSGKLEHPTEGSNSGYVWCVRGGP